MILVCGATGHVGGELVARLVERGLPVSAITRHPERAKLPAAVNVVRADFDDPASIESAMASVESVFFMTTQFWGSAQSPTHAAIAVEAARRAGVRHIVALSALAGGDPGDDPITRWHNESEAIVMRSPAWTLLRPGRFMSNALQWARMIRESGKVQVPFAHRPLASIDPADIAAVALAALTESGHEGKAYKLSGPVAVAPVEEARTLGELLQRALEILPLSNEATRAGMLRSGMSPDAVDVIMTRAEKSDHGSEVLSTVRDVTGRAARTFEQWARAHLDAFR